MSAANQRAARERKSEADLAQAEFVQADLAQADGAKTGAVTPGVTEDHRTRVAREKRTRMRAHLLRAVVSVHETSLNGDSAVIDDVIRQANVARGTFYQYFSSLDDAIAESSSTLMAEMAAGADAIYSSIQDPAMRVATGLFAFPLRASMDRPWGAFLLRNRLEGDNPITRRIRADLAAGMTAAVFSLPSTEAGLDMLLGALRQSVQRIVQGTGELRVAREVAEMVLRSFGLSSDDARRTARKAYENLVDRGPELLPWWNSAA